MVEIDFIHLWQTPNDYNSIDLLMKTIHSQVVDGGKGKIIFTRYNPTFTCGMTDTPQGEMWIKTDRGGSYTYHDPGQIVCYPIIDLVKLKISPFEYNQLLYNWATSSILHVDKTQLLSIRDCGLWLDDKKVGFFGIRVKHGVSSHGFSINLANVNLSEFHKFKPCNKDGVTVALLPFDHETTVKSLIEFCPFKAEGFIDKIPVN